MEILLAILLTIAQILTAGIAITAFSLLIYALTFNLRDRVAKSFALIMACVVVVFTSEALSGVSRDTLLIEFWLRFQWVGLVFLPATYLHFSDALLATTGRPSRGRRRLLVRLSYLISSIFLLMLPYSILVGGLAEDRQGFFYLELARFTWMFSIFYVGGLIWAWTNLWRAYQRTVTSTSLRRMRYLLAGALAPPLGSFPYLIYAADVATSSTVIFWIIVILSNIVVFGLLVSMAYAVAFFGVPWPDRVVKRRLAKWLMRGPVTAFIVLGLTTIIRRAGQFFGIPDTVIVPVLMVVSILLMEHLISIVAPVWERWLFNPGDQNDLRLLQALEERLLTTSDLRQFLESVLAAICDQSQVSSAFVGAIGETGIDLFVSTGWRKALTADDLSENILEIVDQKNGKSEELFTWGDYWIIPLHHRREEYLLGILGVLKSPTHKISDFEWKENILSLADRASLALEDRLRQQQVFTSLKDLTPQVDLIQRLRAAARYDRGGMLIPPEALPEPVDLVQSVKDALSHYWGGPKLSRSPLMRLRIVQQAIDGREDNPVNALRAILRQAIYRVRPEGERRFTAEWILYNILEMKFMEGRKVREVALRLAMSEADLYRKQRVAIEAVASEIVKMEKLAMEEENGTQS